ncbi:MAG: PAS domain S-box protein [Candidatus Riflebacteria bacterium]|nr:PAS domain S-box protein [Candidatus Riflebacteria bacterium]
MSQNPDSPDDPACPWPDLFDRAGFGLSAVDVASGAFLQVNAAFAGRCGYTAAELAGRPALDLHPPEAHRDIAEKLRLAGERGHLAFETVHLRKDGTRFPVLLEVTVIGAPSGRAAWRLCYALDLTERKRTEAALTRMRDDLEQLVVERTRELADSAERHRIVIEQTGQLIYDLDVATGKVFWSGDIEAVTGYVREERQWTDYPSWKSLIHPGDLARLAPRIEELFATPGRFSLEYRLRHKRGHDVFILDRGCSLPDGAGRVNRLMGTMADITERKRSEEQLRCARDAAEAANQAKSGFLASMSHELRTPLTSILAFSEALQDMVYGPLTESQTRALRSIAVSGRHLLDLINDILDVSKIEAGRLELDVRRCSVPEICQAAVQLIAGMAGSKSQSLEFSISPESLALMADPRRLKQMLVNLLGNAVKFTPTGGRLGLEVRCDPEVGAIRFVVWDTGIGMNDSDLTRLFKPFVQIDSALSRRFSGSGLGLALVQRLAELHGGSISVESTPGQGSRFMLLLPWNPMPAVAPVSPETEPGPRPAADLAAPKAGAAASILLADDDPAVSTALCDGLEARGYAVTLACDGQEAVEKFKELRPDLVVMDIHMPVLDGLDAIRLMRSDADPVLRTVPIVALTALAMPGDRERIMAAGATDCRTKPVRIRSLVETIEHWLSKERRNP